MHGINFENLKMEDTIDGERHVEREYTAYAEVENFDWIDLARTRELHEQWQIDYKEGCPLRGRLRLINNRRYTEAVKQPLTGEEGYYECVSDISPDMFEMKKLGCSSGYLKERFTFPAGDNGLVWEVDVFKSKSGGRSSWIKIDLEYNSKNDPIPDFPFDIKNGSLVVEERVMPQSVEEFIDNLWENEWLKLEHSSARSTEKDDL